MAESTPSKSALSLKVWFAKVKEPAQKRNKYTIVIINKFEFPDSCLTW